jgi:hypothetical protein
VVVKGKTHEKQSGGARRIQEAWHAVTIVSRGESCAASSSRRGKRFLSGDAPRLPLTECDRPGSCTCAYRHYPDRRGELRRASDSGKSLGAPKVVVDKRRAPGRRTTDQ